MHVPIRLAAPQPSKSHNFGRSSKLETSMGHRFSDLHVYHIDARRWDLLRSAFRSSDLQIFRSTLFRPLQIYDSCPGCWPGCPRSSYLQCLGSFQIYECVQDLARPPLARSFLRPFGFGATRCGGDIDRRDAFDVFARSRSSEVVPSPIAW